MNVVTVERRLMGNQMSVPNAMPNRLLVTIHQHFTSNIAELILDQVLLPVVSENDAEQTHRRTRGENLTP